MGALLLPLLSYLSPHQMLTSIMGMIDRTRQAVAALKERVVATQAEMDRREVSSLPPPLHCWASVVTKMY